MRPLVEATAVSKRFRATVALDEVSLDLHRGEIVALVGPNGAGKTTLTRILATLLRPDSGQVVIDGHTTPRAARRALGIVPQGATPDPGATPWEHVYYWLLARGVNRAHAAPATEDALRRLSLWDERSREIRRLSGGYQRRVLLAMALAARPRVLLLDEPTGALDPVMRRQTWNLLSQLAEHNGILLTTHDMTEAEALGHRVALIAAGRIVACDTPRALLRLLPSTDKVVLDPGDSLPPLHPYGSTESLAGRIVVFPHDTSAARALAGLLLDRAIPFTVERATLEDVYVRLLATVPVAT